MLRPKQRIPISEKTPEWYRLNAVYWSETCMPAMDENLLNILYKAANGEFDEQDYTYVTNPLNTQNEKYKRFPSKIRNFDMISPIVMMLMGEKRERGLNYTVVARNSNTESQKAELEKQLLDKMLVQELMEQVMEFAQANGQEIDIPQQEKLTVEKVQKKVKGLQDTVAIEGQEALDYIVDYNDFTSKAIENWFNFIITGRMFTFREPFRDEVIYNAINPKEIKYTANSSNRALEDAEAVTHPVRMPVTEVIDKFQGVEGFTEEIIKDLENRYGFQENEGFSKGGNVLQGKSEIDSQEIRAASALWNTITKNGTEKVYNDSAGVLVEHVTWTSMVKIGLLKGQNIFGEPYEEQVDEDFKPTSGETVEWVWVKRKEQVYLIDDRFAVGGEPIPHTTSDIRNPEACKGPYNGKILNMKNVNPQSIVQKLLPYQIKYNIIHYYIERSMAKNMDKIVVFPLGLVPNKEGFSTESSMYYSMANGFLFVDETAKNFQTALNGVKVLDAGLGQYINQLYGYLQIIKQEAKDVVGITPGREGQMANSNDGKALMENSVFRSSIMTAEFFAQAEECEQRDLNYCMEISKYAFSSGKKAMFLNKDRRKVLLNVNPESFCFSDYLVRASNAGKDLQQLNQAKANAQALAQNSEGKVTPMLKLLRSNNISQLTEEMERVEEEFEQRQQQAAQQQQESDKYVADTNLAAKQLELDWKYYNTDKNAEVQMAKAEMDGEVSLRQEKFNTENSGEDVIDFLEHNRERERDNRELSIKERELLAKERMNKENNDVKKYVADKSVQIARTNK